MRRIRRPTERDIEPFHKLCRRLEENAFLHGQKAPKAISDSELNNLMERNALYVSTEAYRVFSYVVITHDLGDAFFFESHSFRKQDDLLEKFDFKGEQLTVLTHFEIDPACQYKTEGKELLSDT